jgi:copper(I)-binding protein
MRIKFLFLTALLAFAAPALARPTHARPNPITVSGGEIRVSLGGSPNSAAYMTIANDGPRPDRLLSVACDCAAQAIPHLSEMKAGVMTMRATGPVVIPAHGRVVFAPGATHIMLTGLKRPLIAGNGQDMVMRFEHAGVVRAHFAITDHIGAHAGGAMDDMPGMGAMPGMNH